MSFSKIERYQSAKACGGFFEKLLKRVNNWKNRFGYEQLQHVWPKIALVTDNPTTDTRQFYFGRLAIVIGEGNSISVAGDSYRRGKFYFNRIMVVRGPRPKERVSVAWTGNKSVKNVCSLHLASVWGTTNPESVRTRLIAASMRGREKIRRNCRTVGENLFIRTSAIWMKNY